MAISDYSKENDLLPKPSCRGIPQWTRRWQAPPGAAFSECMLELHQRTLRTSQQERVKQEIESMDRQVDDLVHASYRLTEDEIKIVEAK